MKPSNRPLDVYHATEDDGMVNIGKDRRDQKEKITQEIEITPSLDDIPSQKHYHDIFFGIFFILHMIVMLVVAVMYGESPYDYDGDYGNFDHGLTITVDPRSMMNIVFVDFFFGLLISAQSIAFMGKYPLYSINFALLSNTGAWILLTIIGIREKSAILITVGCIATAWGASFSYWVWKHIPFAASIASVAFSVIKSHLTLFLVSFIILMALICWSFWWFYVLIGMIVQTWKCEDGICTGEIDKWVMFGLCVSYYWVFQVLKNILYVTVSHTIGRWWCNPSKDQAHYRSVVKEAFREAVTYSFGTSCVVSIIVSIIQTTKKIFSIFCNYEEEEKTYLKLFVECVLQFFQGFVEYLNEWAYIFVGLYGIGFVAAAKNVRDLFQTNGLTTLRTENIWGNAIFMASAGNGVLCGLFSLIVASTNDDMFMYMNKTDAAVVSFFTGLLVGCMISRITLGVLGSAVITIIVCNGDAPEKLAINHPEYRRELELQTCESWLTSRTASLGSMDVYKLET